VVLQKFTKIGTKVALFALLLLFYAIRTDSKYGRLGCAPVVKNPTPITYPRIQKTYAYTEQEYRLQVGDQLDVKFFYNPELNEQVTIRPDGRISL